VSRDDYRTKDILVRNRITCNRVHNRCHVPYPDRDGDELKCVSLSGAGSATRYFQPQTLGAHSATALNATARPNSKQAHGVTGNVHNITATVYSCYINRNSA